MYGEDSLEFFNPIDEGGMQLPILSPEYWPKLPLWMDTEDPIVGRRFQLVIKGKDGRYGIDAIFGTYTREIQFTPPYLGYTRWIVVGSDRKLYTIGGVNEKSSGGVERSCLRIGGKVSITGPDKCVEGVLERFNFMPRSPIDEEAIAYWQEQNEVAIPKSFLIATKIFNKAYELNYSNNFHTSTVIDSEGTVYEIGIKSTNDRIDYIYLKGNYHIVELTPYIPEGVQPSHPIILYKEEIYRERLGMGRRSILHVLTPSFLGKTAFRVEDAEAPQYNTMMVVEEDGEYRIRFSKITGLDPKKLNVEVNPSGYSIIKDGKHVYFVHNPVDSLNQFWSLLNSV